MESKFGVCVNGAGLGSKFRVCVGGVGLESKFRVCVNGAGLGSKFRVYVSGVGLGSNRVCMSGAGLGLGLGCHRVCVVLFRVYVGAAAAWERVEAPKPRFRKLVGGLEMLLM